MNPPEICGICGCNSCNSFKSNERSVSRQRYWTCLRCEQEPFGVPSQSEYVSVNRIILHSLLSEIVREGVPVSWVRIAQKLLDSKEMKGA